MVIEVSMADMTAAVIEGTGNIGMNAVVKQISYRAPISTLAKVDAMAAQAGRSRNYMLTRLLDVGVDAVSKSLSDETTEALMAREVQVLAEMLDGDNETDSE